MSLGFYFTMAFIVFIAALAMRVFDSSASLYIKNNIRVDYLRIPTKELRKQINLTEDVDFIKKLKYQIKYKWVGNVFIYSALFMVIIGFLTLAFG